MTKPKTNKSPIKCCSRNPEAFIDTKVGSTERMWVIACANCGSFSDAHDRKGAINQWNMQFRKKNPIDTRFVGRLNAAMKK